MEWIKGNLNVKDKTPEQKLALAVIQTNFEDAFGLHDSFLASSNKEMNMRGARDWFNSYQCDFWCDCAGTTGDHVRKLVKVLTERYNSGIITIKEIKWAILKLELKL